MRPVSYVEACQTEITGGKHPVAGLVGQEVQRFGLFRGVLHHGQDSSELVHAILFFSSNTFLAVLSSAINFPVGTFRQGRDGRFPRQSLKFH